MNHLKNETSPYLQQHKDHPVNWYPWCDEAFERAKKENKPIFLSIGYSTCHWCHVMAHESFEDTQVADQLNRDFISVKVDKEERPDLDSIYMSVCQAFTGSGGWPMSLVITPDQKPFFAGTYFPKEQLMDLLDKIDTIWKTDKNRLIQAGEEIVKTLNTAVNKSGHVSSELTEAAVEQFKSAFDETYGGFGRAPKFPTPHHLLFLMNDYEITRDRQTLHMVEKTLVQMYKGGMFDHIGFGFSRYSTDRYFLAPHFEKMLYDNALLLMAYTKAFDITQNTLFKQVAVKTAAYILGEMTSAEGGFYSAQDADSDGVEGKYYVFSYEEIIDLLGKETGKAFNKYYGIKQDGNFEGHSIPNLLHHTELNDGFQEYLPQLYAYRKTRVQLHLDDKILTSWNSLMISAFAMMYRVFDDDIYMKAAQKACEFIEVNLIKQDTVFVSYRKGALGETGFLDDYACYIYGLIELYEASLEQKYLNKAIAFCRKAVTGFYDEEQGGFYLYGREHEQLIMKPKETYDGAIPCGNSIMAYNLVKISQITEEEEFEELAKKQMKFMAGYAPEYPMGHSFYLLALNLFLNPPEKIVCVIKGNVEKMPLHAIIRIVDDSNAEYPLVNDKTTYYVCKHKSCRPPVNTLKDLNKS